MKKIFFIIIALVCITGLNAQSDSAAIPESDFDEVLDFAEQKPEFIGGYDSLTKFIVKHVNYPPLAIEKKIQGTVRVSFVVEKDGSISNIKTVGQALGYGCEEEAMRVVKLMPNFKPGTQNGKRVRIKLVLPIKFKIN